ncbi:GP88 family protein [Microvirga massiliensis]|uniref:GP88 family protein n=1 Tax=Microvirga massiliensis TaxID=1033741 RepID=UPI00062BEA30|nr:hypothetical protein [Microvirga massiliensis]
MATRKATKATAPKANKAKAPKAKKVYTAADIIFDLSKLDPELRKDIEENWCHLFAKFPERLIRIESDAKTIKGEKIGFMTAILYMAPHAISGQNLCALALLARCADPCLNLSGRGTFDVNQMARLRKALYWIQYRERFLKQLHKEIRLAKAQAERQGFILLVRLNGTTDILWERYGVPQAHADIQFYDYTKIPNRNVPANYDLTFSYSGVPQFAPFVRRAIEKHMRIAVVFRSRAAVEHYLTSGETFMGMPVVDGDDTDVRHLDPQAAVVALYAKGKAITDQSGFVVG